MGYTTSPLRYPGGKTRLAKFIAQLIRKNDLVGGEYVEPYAGGAGIAWSLLFADVVSRVHINDIDSSVTAFWASTFDHTEELCQLIERTPIAMEEWHKQKAILADREGHSDLELGFATFFLNRTNRSGILRGGVIGGKEQNGPWMMDARFNKQELIARIRRIAAYKSRVTVSEKDALVFLRQTLPGLPGRSLIYLDPPYFRQGANLYLNYYGQEDHARVCDFLNDVHHNWIVTYDFEPAIERLYAGRKKLTYKLSYSAADRYAGTELMFLSPDLHIPPVGLPGRIV